MSDNSQVVSSVVVDGDGTVIAYDARPDDLADDEFWSRAPTELSSVQLA